MDQDHSLQVDAREKGKLKIDDGEVAELRSQLTDAESAACEDPMVRRYIRACGGDHNQVTDGDCCDCLVKSRRCRS